MRRLVILAALVAVAGCGSSSTAADDHAIRGVVKSYFAAVANKDGPGACALMSPTAQAKTASDATKAKVGTTCAAGMAEVGRRVQAGGGQQALLTTKVSSVRITGAHASAALLTLGQKGGIFLHKLGGRWLVAQGAQD